MNLWMIGLDASVFAGSNAGGNTTARLQNYLAELRKRDPGSTLTDLIFTRHAYQAASPEDGLNLIPIQAANAQFFPLVAISAIRKLSLPAPDLITVQSPFEAGLLGLALKRKFTAPLEAQIHLHLLSPYWIQEHQVWNRVRLRMARRTLKKSSRIRVVSSPIRDALVHQWRIPAQKIAVLPVPTTTPLDLGSSTLPGDLKDSGRKLILWVGRRDPSKNLPGLFRVIETIAARRKDASFALLGSGIPQAWDRYRDRQVGLHERVYTPGAVAYDQLPAWYHRADVVILPSLHEGFGRVLLESYLFSTPAVATRCGGPQDIIVDQETGFLTPIEDLAAFSQCAEWLLDHPEQAAAMGARGRQLVLERFNPQALVDQMVEGWLQLASGKGAR